MAAFCNLSVLANSVIRVNAIDSLCFNDPRPDFCPTNIDSRFVFNVSACFIKKGCFKAFSADNLVSGFGSSNDSTNSLQDSEIVSQGAL